MSGCIIAITKQYVGGMVFDPSGRKQDGDVFNLWRDFGVTPRPGIMGSCSRNTSEPSFATATTRICSHYMLDWMADMVQRPAKQGEVAAVMRSKVEGTGKSLVMRTLRHILGPAWLRHFQRETPDRQFQRAHQRDFIFLGADEALFAGSPIPRRHHEERHHRNRFWSSNRKGRDAVQSPNYLHLMMATNEDWAVPASLRSRRWFVLDVNETHANDHDYFAAIQDELDNGGHEAMLHELLHRDISQHQPPRRAGHSRADRSTHPFSSDTHHRVVDRLLCHAATCFRSKLGLER